MKRNRLKVQKPLAGSTPVVVRCGVPYQGRPCGSPLAAVAPHRDPHTHALDYQRLWLRANQYSADGSLSPVFFRLWLTEDRLTIGTFKDGTEVTSVEPAAPDELLVECLRGRHSTTLMRADIETAVAQWRGDPLSRMVVLTRP